VGARQDVDLIDTMDDATSEHYSLFFTDQEGTASSFQGVKEVILAHGLFCSLYTDRGSHYWLTPEAGARSTRPIRPSSAEPCTSWASR